MYILVCTKKDIVAQTNPPKTEDKSGPTELIYRRRRKCEIWRFGWKKGNCGVMTEKCLEEGYWMYRETRRLKIEVS